MMTPPDDPPEPDLSGALPCPQCDYPPHCRKHGVQYVEYHLYCDQNHVRGAWAGTLGKAIEYWNTEVETIKAENLKAQQ